LLLHLLLGVGMRHSFMSANTKMVAHKHDIHGCPEHSETARRGK
jgi:hypothetical protein